MNLDAAIEVKLYAELVGTFTQIYARMNYAILFGEGAHAEFLELRKKDMGAAEALYAQKLGALSRVAAREALTEIVKPLLHIRKNSPEQIGYVNPTGPPLCGQPFFGWLDRICDAGVFDKVRGNREVCPKCEEKFREAAR